jgi:hypothetical protein
MAFCITLSISMSARWLRAGKVLIALIAIMASLTLSAAALAPSHNHGSATSQHHCALCEIAHLPCLAASVRISLQPPNKVSWDVSEAYSGSRLKPSCLASFSRGPPA